MEHLISELQQKEVVDIANGARYGFIGDLELDPQTGAITNVIIPGKSRCFGLLGHEDDIFFPWSAVKRIGADIILVETVSTSQSHPEIVENT